MSYLEREMQIEIGLVVKSGTAPQKGKIKSRRRDTGDEIVLETNGLGFAIKIKSLNDFLRQIRY